MLCRDQAAVIGAVQPHSQGGAWEQGYTWSRDLNIHISIAAVLWQSSLLTICSVHVLPCCLATQNVIYLLQLGKLVR